VKITLKPTDRVAAYARYSSDAQREASTEDQLHLLRRWVREAGSELRPEMEIRDNGVSGLVNSRDGLNRLMALARSGAVNVVVVEDLSRLSRSEAGLFAFLDHLDSLSVRLIGVKDGTDSSDPSARMLMGFTAVMNAEYSRRLGRTTFRGLEGRANLGFHTGGRALGYTTQETTSSGNGSVIGYKLVVHPDEAKTVVLIFGMYAEGYSYRAIAKELIRRGLPTARLGTDYRWQGWSTGGVRSILRNRRYLGEVRYNVRQWVRVPGTKKRHPRFKDPSEVISWREESLRIISDDLWARVEARRAATHAFYTKTPDGRLKGKARAGHSTNYPLSGLLVCGECGGGMVIMGSTPRRYVCGNHHKGRTCTNRRSLREAEVRARVLAALTDALTVPAVAYILKRVEARLSEMAAKTPDEMKAAEARAAEARRKSVRYAELLLDEKVESATLKRLLGEAEAAERAAEAELTRLRSEGMDVPSLPSPEEIVLRAVEVVAACEKSPVAAREALRGVLREERIVVAPEPTGPVWAHFDLLPLGFRTKKRRPGGVPGRRIRRELRGQDFSVEADRAAGGVCRRLVGPGDVVLGGARAGGRAEARGRDVRPPVSSSRGKVSRCHG
jgi:DNA invertase Pin-like site-specific DNA recombinase